MLGQGTSVLWAVLLQVSQRGLQQIQRVGEASCAGVVAAQLHLQAGRHQAGRVAHAVPQRESAFALGGAFGRAAQRVQAGCDVEGLLSMASPRSPSSSAASVARRAARSAFAVWPARCST